MIKRAVFIAGAAVGLVAASSLSEEQRQQIRSRLPSMPSGPRTRRVATAGHDAASSVADAATTAVESLSQQVQHTANDVVESN